jgi:hypothetical protein
MTLSFLLFVFLSYGLAFLAADATIFGVSAKAFLEDPTDEEYIREAGILPFRRWLLQFPIGFVRRFFQKLMKCYFCMGVWSGASAHLLLTLYANVNPNWRNSYFLWGPIDSKNLVIGSTIAAVLGAGCTYVIDLVVGYLERLQE